MRRLAGRFLLDRQLRVTSGADVWLALDEKLNRSVAVYLMTSGTGSTSEVLSAARLAASVPDTRFVQVLDAVDDGRSAYVVTEWLIDAVDLATRLADGPMPSWEAVGLAIEVAEAMASAHSSGLTHQRLDPHNVLRTESGQVKIHGLRLESALFGVVPATAEDARSADVRGIGALLYASLTGYWPFGEAYGEAYGLVAAPQDALGPVPPATLHPDVPSDVDSVVMRLLFAGVPLPDSTQPPAPKDVDEETLAVPRLPVASCDEAIEALSGLRRSRPHPPTPAQPQYPVTERVDSHRDQSFPPYEPQYRYGRDPGARFDDTGMVRHGPGASGREEGGSRKVMFAAVGVLALVGSGLLGWQLVDHQQPPPNSPTSTSSASAKVAPKQLKIVDATLWQSSMGRSENADTVRNTITGRSPAWKTFGYFDGPKLAEKPGTGIIYDLGQVRSVDHVTVRIGASGATLELRAANPDVTEVPVMEDRKAPREFTVVDSQTAADTQVTLTAKKPVRARFVLVWFTALPNQGPSGGGGGPYRDSISLVRVFGSG
jgi:serine/threonine protein kinase